MKRMGEGYLSRFKCSMYKQKNEKKYLYKLPSIISSILVLVLYSSIIY